MNTVGPYHNRQETYGYFSLPFCIGVKQSISHYHETLSEALQGVELEFSGYEIDFQGNFFFVVFLLSVQVNIRCTRNCIRLICDKQILFIFISDPISTTEICMVELNAEKVKAFAYAVKNEYWYQMYIDGLPIWGKVGEKDNKQFYIYTHKRFDIGYNGKRIIDINLTNEKRELIQEGAKIKFTYEVNWKPSTVKFEDRFDKYLDPNFFQHRVRLFV